MSKPEKPPKIQENASNASERIGAVSRACACGCGQIFEPKRKWQIYVSDKHRVIAHRSRLRIIRKDIESVIVRLEEILQGLPFYQE